MRDNKPVIPHHLGITHLTGTLPHNVTVFPGHASRMSGAILIDRLDKRLAVLELSDRDASIRATGSPDLIRDIRRSKSRNMRTGNLSRLAEALECDPAYLTGEQDTPRDKPAEGEPAPARASLTLSDWEMELLALTRSMPEERDHILAIVRAMYGVSQSAAADSRGRRRAS